MLQADTLSSKALQSVSFNSNVFASLHRLRIQSHKAPIQASPDIALVRTFPQWLAYSMFLKLPCFLPKSTTYLPSDAQNTCPHVNTHRRGTRLRPSTVGARPKRDPHTPTDGSTCTYIDHHEPLLCRDSFKDSVPLQGEISVESGAEKPSHPSLAEHVLCFPSLKQCVSHHTYGIAQDSIWFCA